MHEDARTELRHHLRIPIRFYSTDGSRETQTEATNISQSGLVMQSPKPLAVGSTLLLVLRVPTEISASVFSELRCMGRVIHEQQTADGKLGYGVKIEAMAPRRVLGLWNGEDKEPRAAQV